MALNRHALILSRGDPGLFDVLRRVGRAAAATVFGGPVAGVSTFFRPLGPSGSGLPAATSIARPGGSIGGISIPRLRGTGVPAVSGGPGTPAMTSNGCAQGFHPNKSSYATQAGFVAKGTRCVRNRRRNLSNGKANSRALRRLVAWDKQERKRSKALRSIARK